jgi:Secretion system C-terminal sorting domain
LVGSQAISATTAWTVTVPANTLYYNATITVTAQAAGATESVGCSGTTVGCTSPLTPSITPTSASIVVGNTVTFTVSNVQAGNWYALLDNSGNSYATSSYRATTSSFGITTSTFNSSGTYNLKVTADALTGCPASFTSATITVNNSLPVKLIRFTGSTTNDRVELLWETSNEINLSHFEVEENSNGRMFRSVARVEPKTGIRLTKNYELSLPNTMIGSFQYRLKMVDADGKYEYSPILNLRRTNLLNQIAAGPNPFTDRITVNFRAVKAETVTVLINDVSGRQIQRLTKHLDKGNNVINIGGLSTIQNGLYFIYIINEEGRNVFNEKLVK